MAVMNSFQPDKSKEPATGKISGQSELSSASEHLLDLSTDSLSIGKIADSALAVWLEEQSGVADGYFRADLVQNIHSAIAARASELMADGSRSAPWRAGTRWFHTRDDGAAQHPALYVSQSPQESGRVLLDPNRMFRDESVAAECCGIDRQGKYLAW